MPDSPTLVAALARLAPKTRLHPQLTHLNPESGRFKQIDAQRVDESDGGVQEISELLRSQGTFAAYEQGTVRRSPSGAQSFRLDDVAHWCLAQARRRSPERVVAQLHEFVSRNELSLVEVIAIWGLTPEHRLDLGHTITLDLLANLPPSGVKDQLTGVKDTPHTGGTSFPLPRPAAVLSSPLTMSPVFLTGPGTETSTPTNSEALRIIASCLCLVTDASVCEIASWFQCDVSTPLVGGVLGWSGQSVEHVFHTAVPPTPIDEARARTLISEFLGLDPVVRARLTLPLRRLNIAMRRHDPTDVALELGIALEALLTGNEPHDAPISYRVRQRGAALLAGSPAERRRHFNILKILYDFRSKAAHGAPLPENVSCDGGRLDTRDFLHVGTKLCAEILRHVIHRGSVPDWDGYILGW